MSLPLSCSRPRGKYFYSFSHNVTHTPGFAWVGKFQASCSLLHSHCMAPVEQSTLCWVGCGAPCEGWAMGGDTLLFLALFSSWIKLFNFSACGAHPIWMEKLSLWSKCVDFKKNKYIDFKKLRYSFMCHYAFQPKTFFLARRKVVLRRNHFPPVSGSNINPYD